MPATDAPICTVLLPGLACGPGLFVHQLPTLWGFGPVMVADHTRDDTIAAIARRVLDDAPPRLSLVGMAMGGYIALEMMRQEPQRVERLALIGTSARPPSQEHRDHLTRMIGLASSGRFEEIPERVFPTIVHPDRRDDLDLRHSHAAMVAATGADAYMRQARANRNRMDSRPYLGQIGCPTLVIAGDHDGKASRGDADELIEGIPNSRLAVIERCGHLATMEQPTLVNAALAGWLGA